MKLRWRQCRRAGVRGLAGLSLVALVAWLTPAVAAGASTAPINDSYLESLVITQASTTGQGGIYHDVEDTSLATTQNDLFDPDPFGTVTSGGGREPTSCDGRSYGNTIWYDIRPKLTGEVELQADGFGSVIAIYRYSPTSSRIIREVGCQASASVANDYVYPAELTGGADYTVQVGGLSTASGFMSGRVEFQMAFYTDRDGDNTFDVLDKCPTLPGVNQYAGCPPTLHPFPRLDYTSLSDGAIKLKFLEIDQLPSGARVHVSCQGCGIKESVTSGPHADSAKISAFSGKLLSNGNKLEIYVTKGRAGHKLYRYGAIGSYISYTARNGTLSDRVLRCLMPGSLTPRTTCPPGGKRKIAPSTRHAIPIQDKGRSSSSRG